MQAVVQLGALQFALTRSFTTHLPPLEGRPFTHLDGDLVQLVESDGKAYLVIDHRREPEAQRPAWVEVWTQTNPGEAPITALLALADVYEVPAG
ncbi:MAG: hypothetical protein ACKVT1_18910 [Dehalococcoidia bacterium]